MAPSVVVEDPKSIWSQSQPVQKRCFLPRPSYTIVEQPIGTHRPIRVVCMGAGYSGVMMAIVFSRKMAGKNAELVIY